MKCALNLRFLIVQKPNSIQLLEDYAPRSPGSLSELPPLSEDPRSAPGIGSLSQSSVLTVIL